MSLSRFRKGRPDRFTMISNDAVDTYDILTVGLLTVLLRLPDDWRTTMDELAAKRGASRRALYASMRDLVEGGNVVKVKYQNAKGHWCTDSYTFDPPCTPQEAQAISDEYLGLHRIIEPARLDPAWLAEQGVPPAPPEEDAPPPPFGSPATGLPNRQAGPTRANAENPSSHRPVGNRQAGSRQALKKTVPKTEDQDLPSDRGATATAVRPKTRKKREEEATQPPVGQTQGNPHTPAAEAAATLLGALPPRFKTGAKPWQLTDVVRRLVPLLEAGWTPEALTEELTRDFDDAHKPVGLWIHRLGRLPLLPPDPDLAPPRPDPVPDGNPWCGLCTGPHRRLVEVDGEGAPLERPVRCACNPGSAANRSYRVTPGGSLGPEAMRAASLRALEATYPDSFPDV